jgi:hypoxanthine phosphoribosyltransferase
MARAASDLGITGADPDLVFGDRHSLVEETLIEQPHLPPLRWLLQPDDTRFAHPAEVEFASLLSFYGIRWAYEPTTFAVRWHEDGCPAEHVTPDFYLPDFDQYVELTTMRQRLVTRKNRKFRLLRERYPNLRVRMLYLRDFERLRDTYHAASSAREGRPAATLVAAPDVEARIAEMAGELAAAWQGPSRDGRGERPLLVGLGAGSERFLAALSESVRRHGAAVDACSVDLTRYPGPEPAVRARLTRRPRFPVAGRAVVIVQDVLSTGLSAAFVADCLHRNGAASVAICALLDRSAARIVNLPIVCRGFAAPDTALGGFGLSRWRAYRDLPYIAEIETV